MNKFFLASLSHHSATRAQQKCHRTSAISPNTLQSHRLRLVPKLSPRCRNNPNQRGQRQVRLARILPESIKTTYTCATSVVKVYLTVGIWPKRCPRRMGEKQQVLNSLNEVRKFTFDKGTIPLALPRDTWLSFLEEYCNLSFLSHCC
jgi:hypothetical protein